MDWRKFDSGASIVRALASGDVQIGNLGSSPLAVATSQQVPIEVSCWRQNWVTPKRWW